MSERLPPPYGLRLQRNQPLTFEFEGQTMTGFTGDTLASALLANGVWLMSRSFKYHRPRGPLTMAGQDANTLVQLPGAPNVLADTLPLRQGLCAFGQNYSGSLRRDRNAWLDKCGRFLKVGFYYRAFFKPAGSWRLWEPWIRRTAGLGVLNTTTPRSRFTDKAYLFCDIAVVGAGPAGLAAALAAARAGRQVTLIEQEPELGGSLNFYRFEVDEAHAEATRARLLADIAANANIRVLTGTSCSGWFADHYLSLLQGERLYKLRASQTVFACGSYAQSAVFRGNDLPGVVTAEAALRLIKLYAVKPARSAVVFTANDAGYLSALTLHEAGVALAAVIDLRAAPPPVCLATLSAAGVRLITGAAVYEATGRHQQLAAVEVRSRHADGSLARSGEVIACDLLAMSVGAMPAWHLPCVAGAQLQFVAASNSFSLQGLAKGVALAGSVRGVEGLAATLADGDAAIAELLGKAIAPAVPPAPPTLLAVFPHPKGKDFVDFDEDLQVQDIVDATRLGYRHMQLLKRFSTLGMGPSQGRHAALAAALISAQATARNACEPSITTARAPVVAEPLALLAGRSFHPYRQTPMHARHLAAGAQMMPAGLWQRPAYYGHANARAEAIAREVTQVRTQVGLIDLSTLGGIELRGPEALTFLNRLYTANFSKLAIGRVRYALKCNLQGAVADDGVVVRLAAQHYYLTATTTGVDRVYREMTHWNAQWRLAVDIYNVTSSFAAVNLAGPRARTVLQSLLPQLDLSHQALPYMAACEATLYDMPARILRVGFVGELGFEIHVPAAFGPTLWDALMAAGEAHGIAPFGVEAQRVLRLEKGHLIVGQDSDALSTPQELNMSWAVAMTKPFFVGQRSLELLAAEPAKRMLHAFTLPAEVPVPAEGQLVLDNNDVVGHVTSVAFSPTLGHPIGLAYAKPEQTVLWIKGEGGRLLAAKVVTPPFYDPNNTRQQEAAP